MRRLTLIAVALIVSSAAASADTYTHHFADGTVLSTTCTRSVYGLNCFSSYRVDTFTGNSARVISAPVDAIPAPADWAKNCSTSCAK